MDEKDHLFSKNLSDLSIGQLKDVCDGVDKSFTAIWKAPFQSKLLAQDGEESVRAAHLHQRDVQLTANKFLEFPKPEVSFVAKIDDLQQDNVRLTHEISKWEHRFATESKRRRAAELEASELKLTIQQLQMDNEKLEKHINENRALLVWLQHQKEIKAFVNNLNVIKTDFILKLALCTAYVSMVSSELHN